MLSTAQGTTRYDRSFDIQFWLFDCRFLAFRLPFVEAEALNFIPAGLTARSVIRGSASGSTSPGPVVCPCVYAFRWLVRLPWLSGVSCGVAFGVGGRLGHRSSLGSESGSGLMKSGSWAAQARGIDVRVGGCGCQCQYMRSGSRTTCYLLTEDLRIVRADSEME
ncbi:hypothetical protein DENSPDRAFT_845866 [Dentipellis sp. KUC8613]|nr:hypothetical protein DENSPDRAFT_845866 [Dentipellis sp. KUC8613]